MARSRRGRRRGLLALGFTGCCALLVAVLLAALAWRLDTYDRNIERLGGAVPEEQGRPDDDPGENWLLIGSDMRGDSTPGRWRSGEAHADVIMLLHVPEEEDRAYVVAIPRDSWVEIPGHGRDKIAEALGLGGPRLLTEAVEEMSGVRVDHFAAVDFAGFEEMTDALGGVTIDLPHDVYDQTNGWYWEAGENHMDGAEALRFVRERKGLGGSDTDRIKRQQVFLRAMAEKAAGEEIRGDPRRLDAFLLAASGAVAVDEDTTMDMMRALAVRLVGIGAENTAFMSLPVQETGWEGERNVVYLDEEVADGVFERIRDGGLADYMDERELEHEADRIEVDPSMGG
ncbi:LCP family protein [Nocardiopsis composta]|uniref:LCP family protein required for cell wall assembly n=1 Tax=Nocardiopsis composta TaxID=157465 RepID=A0A7W8QLJ5_9ACTN|nr:LCP family protein [Nocardiopsis composta]MBB5432484.1 LCP family protein required for cell wall assembly [Nocardiopsis composta]